MFVALRLMYFSLTSLSICNSMLRMFWNSCLAVPTSFAGLFDRTDYTLYVFDPQRVTLADCTLTFRITGNGQNVRSFTESLIEHIGSGAPIPDWRLMEIATDNYIDPEKAWAYAEYVGWMS